ncbi:MAG: site-2 protease family protein [Clostridia bacterium]|nr:site-2 protease family protein [Clostridia bacterium]
MLFFLIQNRGNVSLTAFFAVLLSYGLLVLICLPFHEFSHALTAYCLGDDTAKRQGRLTLHPGAHLDLIGTLMLVLAGIGFAKPVPISPYRFRHRKLGMALTAAAGPLSNLLLAFLSMAVFRVILLFDLPETVLLVCNIIFINILASVNISLAVFNLLPLFPLDGFRIFSLFLPEKWTYQLEKYHQWITYGVLLLVFLGAFDKPMTFIHTQVINFFATILGY